MNTEEHEKSYLVHQSRMSAAVEAEEMNLMAILKPRIFIDGDYWCVLYGENLVEGIAGFGDTPRKAVWDFNKAWDKTIPENSLKKKMMEQFDAAITAIKDA